MDLHTYISAKLETVMNDSEQLWARASSAFCGKKQEPTCCRSLTDACQYFSGKCKEVLISLHCQRPCGGPICKTGYSFAMLYCITHVSVHLLLQPSGAACQ